MITVMGATGRTGGQIAAGLLKAGEQVRAVGRSAERLAPLAEAGAELAVGDANAPDFLAGALRGADAVYTLLPFDPAGTDFHGAADRVGEAIVAAVRDSGVPGVVFLSAIGADLPGGTGVVESLHRQEQRLAELTDTNVLILRPGSFFENFFDSLPLIKVHGIMGDSIAPDTPIPMIATRDIADAAVTALRNRDWNGFVVRELAGERDISHAEVAAILADRLAVPGLRYVQFSEAHVEEVLTDAGVSADFAKQYLLMNRVISNQTVRPLRGRNPENTTATRFEEFAGELARAYSEKLT